jgi:hypothetical protein
MWSMSRGSSPRLFPYKNNSEIDNPKQFCKEAPGFLKNLPTVVEPSLVYQSMVWTEWTLLGSVWMGMSG